MKVTLRWNANPVLQQVSQYNIYRNGKLVGSSPTPSFTMKRPPNRSSLFVTAVNQTGESKPSSSITL